MLHLMSGCSGQKLRVQSACTVDNAPVQEAAQACNNLKTCQAATLESGIDVGQGITVGPGKFVKNNKHRTLNKRRA